MHGSLGFMVNNHPTPKAGPKNKGGYCKPACILCCILQPDWSLLLLVNIEVAYRQHHFTTSCGIGNRIYIFLSYNTYLLL